MLSDFVAILSGHGIQCPSDLMLLIRALVTLEGVGRDLDPQFNLAEYLAPCVESIVKERYDPQRIAKRMLGEARTFLQVAHDLPLYLGRSLEKLSKDDLKVQFEHSGLDHFITEIDRSSNRLVIGLVMSSLIVASALVIRTSTASLLFSIPLFLLWSLLGVWLIYGVFRSGRL
jgi:ubiquinone biosynthesis protein